MGITLLSISIFYLNVMSIPALFVLQLSSFACLWLAIAQWFERNPFHLNRTKEQHMDWMALLQYVLICVVCGLMFMWDPQRFDWLTNGSRLYFTLTVANIAYYIVHIIAAPYYLNEPLVLDKVIHHVGFMVLFGTALLLGHWEYIFIWVGFLSLLYAIPFKIMLILKAARHPQTYLWYLIQYGAWVVLRVGIFGALMIYYFYGIDKSALPLSFFWSIFVPFTFLLNTVLTIYWTIDMSRTASKTWQRRFSRRARAVEVRS